MKRSDLDYLNPLAALLAYWPLLVGGGIVVATGVYVVIVAVSGACGR